MPARWPERDQMYAFCANAYPKLVDMLQDLVLSHEQLEKQRGYARATYSANARKLLRDLGEK